jgi:hypothetical protein
MAGGERKFLISSGGDTRGRYTARQGDCVFIMSIHNKLDVY